MKLIKILFFLFFLISVAIAQSGKKQKLTLGFMPYISAEILQEKYTPLANYLSKELDMDVEIVIAQNYTKHIEDTGEDKLDISFLGGSPYVQIINKYGQKPLLVRYEFNEKPTFGSVIFVSKNSPIQKLHELHGKSFAFGNKKSTLSTQVPLYMLMEKGLRLSMFSHYEHLNNHENVIYGVALGDFDAGAVAQEVFREHKDKNIKLLASSEDISTHVFVTRSTLPHSLYEKIKAAFLKIKKSNKHQLILRSISPSLTGFVEAKESDYDFHKKMLKVVIPELLKSEI